MVPYHANILSDHELGQGEHRLSDSITRQKCHPTYRMQSWSPSTQYISDTSDVPMLSLDKLFGIKFGFRPYSRIRSPSNNAVACYISERVCGTTIPFHVIMRVHGYHPLLRNHTLHSSQQSDHERGTRNERQENEVWYA